MEDNFMFLHIVGMIVFSKLLRPKSYICIDSYRISENNIEDKDTGRRNPQGDSRTFISGLTKTFFNDK